MNSTRTTGGNALEDARAAPPRCLLCGRPPAVLGVFVPRHPGRVGAAPGTALPYALCRKCFRRAGAARRAGDVLLRRLAAANGLN